MSNGPHKFDNKPLRDAGKETVPEEVKDHVAEAKIARKSSSHCVAFTTLLSLHNGEKIPIGDLGYFGNPDFDYKCNQGKPSRSLINWANLEVFPVACAFTNVDVPMRLISAEDLETKESYTTLVSDDHIFVTEITDTQISILYAKELKKADTVVLVQNSKAKITDIREQSSEEIGHNVSVASKAKLDEISQMWNKEPKDRNEQEQRLEKDLRTPEHFDSDFGLPRLHDHVIFFDNFASFDQVAHDWIIDRSTE